MPRAVQSVITFLDIQSIVRAGSRVEKGLAGVIAYPARSELRDCGCRIRVWREHLGGSGRFFRCRTAHCSASWLGFGSARR